MRRKQPIKDVRCTVRIIVGGRTVKTIKRRLTMQQAIREIGGEPLAIEGRLLTTVPLNKKRTIVRGVSVCLMYVWGYQPNGHTMSIRMGLGDAREVIRAGVPL